MILSTYCIKSMYLKVQLFCSFLILMFNIKQGDFKQNFIELGQYRSLKLTKLIFACATVLKYFMGIWCALFAK